MKKLTVILMVLVLLSSLFAFPVYAAEDEGTINFYKFNYKNNTLYLKNDGSYYSLPLSLDLSSTPFFEKSEKLGSDNPIWRIDLPAFAKEKNRNTIIIVDFITFLASDSYIYMPLTLFNKDEEGYCKDFLYLILKVNKKTGTYEVIELSGADSYPYMIKKYKDKLYVYIQGGPLYYLSKNNELVSTYLPMYISVDSQSSSKSRYVYGIDYSLKGDEILSVASLRTMKKVKEIKAVIGYYATNSKLYYGKMVNSRFRVYSAGPNGSKPQVIFSKKAKKGSRYRLAKVTSKYIYYKEYRSDMSFPIYYKYTRSTKKSTTIGYEEYTTNTSDYFEGYLDPVG